MKTIALLCCLTAMGCFAHGKAVPYQGSTPAATAVRHFLGINLIDSIDFIRWKLVIDTDHYTLDCEYGLSKPNTNGFSNEQKVSLQGELIKQDVYYILKQKEKRFYIRNINPNLLHLLDENKNMLVGNGGYSYTLNTNIPSTSSECNRTSQQHVIDHITAFEGRTPCQPLATLLQQQRSAACNKLKWYIILYTDTVTKQPAYYLIGGRQYKPETMRRGNWKIEKRSDGRIFYILDPEKKTAAVHLLQADDNILYFTDAEGHLLTGNENFSYTLNRTYIRHLK